MWASLLGLLVQNQQCCAHFTLFVAWCHCCWGPSWCFPHQSLDLWKQNRTNSHVQHPKQMQQHAPPCGHCGEWGQHKFEFQTMNELIVIVSTNKMLVNGWCSNCWKLIVLLLLHPPCHLANCWNYTKIALPSKHDKHVLDLDQDDWQNLERFSVSHWFKPSAHAQVLLLMTSLLSTVTPSSMHVKPLCPQTLSAFFMFVVLGSN